MITKLQVKHIQALAEKKSRTDAGEFVVEGEKQVLEVLASGWTIKALFALPEWFQQHTSNKQLNEIPCHTITPNEMARISFLKTPSSVLAILALPSPNKINTSSKALLVDTLQDPGNLGTIIRIGCVYLFGACADPWQPKCIQSTMGSFLRVTTIPLQTISEVSALPFTHRFAATLQGSAPNQNFIHQPGLLMIGNESRGLHPELQALSTHQVTLPRMGGAESLNAAVATGILCHVWIC
jgi:TrmH family RNA methyltransferase